MRFTRRAALAGMTAALAAPVAATAASLPRGLRPLPRNEAIPDVAFKDATGRDVGFVEMRGKPAVAMFWATWCTVCYGEMPKVDALQAAMGARAHIVPLSIDRGGMPAVQAYYRKRGLSALGAYHDQESIFASIMGIRGVPTAFVLDAQGMMAAVGEGPVDWDSADMQAYLASLA